MNAHNRQQHCRALNCLGDKAFVNIAWLFHSCVLPVASPTSCYGTWRLLFGKASAPNPICHSALHNSPLQVCPRSPSNGQPGRCRENRQERRFACKPVGHSHGGHGILAGMVRGGKGRLVCSTTRIIEKSCASVRGPCRALVLFMIARNGEWCKQGCIVA